MRNPLAWRRLRMFAIALVAAGLPLVAGTFAAPVSSHSLDNAPRTWRVTVGASMQPRQERSSRLTWARVSWRKNSHIWPHSSSLNQISVMPSVYLLLPKCQQNLVDLFGMWRPA